MAEIPLTKGFVALVDDEDADRVLAHSWRYCFGKNDSTPYARATVTVARRQRRNISLHRFILSAPDGVLVDHRNRNGLDCRRSNLRLATFAQNTAYSLRQRGASGYRGVFATGAPGIWAASIGSGGKGRWLGTYDTAEGAARAYDAAAIADHGEFAVLNFPEELGATEVARRGHVRDGRVIRRRAIRKIGVAGFRGVCIDRSTSKSAIYRAELLAGGARYRLGRFQTAEEAALAYDRAAREHLGDLAILNFPEAQHG